MLKIDIKIKMEEKENFKDVHNLIKKAFESAKHSDGNEQDLVDSLRNGNGFIPELSLVAKINGMLVGHIMFSKAKVGEIDVVALAPVSVLPEYQNMGVGTALINAGHNIAEELGYGYSVVLGSEDYYPRFGYVQSELLGVETMDGVSKENFMVKQLSQYVDSISGKMIYAKEFNIE
ncbi:MAG: N-acetyltransferase [Peptostreptococcus sp.]|uniref:GNAT family N-acetyltransferase n=1 Tax=Peptostreptococcus sp. TaxID=1262 RepID=UPI002FC8B3A7